MDTEEMYRRGVADAEQDEVHPFFYEHYYPYRRAVNRTRRRLHKPALLPSNRRRIGIGLLVVLVLAGGWLLYRRQADQTALLARGNMPTAAPLATGLPTATPIFPTATPLPTPTAVALHVGGQATVVIKGGVLRVRQDPSITAPIKITFKDGEKITIEDGPVDADGFTWWRIKNDRGTGWSAQQSKEGEAWFQPAAP